MNDEAFNSMLDRVSEWAGSLPAWQRESIRALEQQMKCREGTAYYEVEVSDAQPGADGDQ